MKRKIEILVVLYKKQLRELTESSENFVSEYHHTKEAAKMETLQEVIRDLEYILNKKP